jgi:ribulose kinase
LPFVAGSSPLEVSDTGQQHYSLAVSVVNVYDAAVTNGYVYAATGRSAAGALNC